jgi:hypothetical protein
MRNPALTIAVGVLCYITACADGEPYAPRRGPGLSGAVTLLAPGPGGLFKQNDPTIGCDAHADRGFGFRLVFDWEDVEGVEQYDIVLQHVGSPIAAVRERVIESKHERTWCNAFVADFNLDQWIWRVAAIGPSSSGAVPDTLWSETREYGFEPCRHADGRPCSAPAP